MAFADEVQSRLQVLLDDVKVQPCGGQSPGDNLELSGDAILLSLKQVKGHSPCIVRLKQLRLLVDQPLLPDRQFALLSLGVGSRCGEVRSKRHLDASPKIDRELKRLVVLLDHGLDVSDEKRFASAIGALLVATDADEVRIDATLAVLGVGDDEAAAAAAAIDGGL